MSARVALVTGGGGGIGSAIARALAADGCMVAVCDLDEAACTSVVGGLRREEAHEANAAADVLACRLDVTDAASVAETVATVTERLGAVNVLVNCAGWDELRPFLDTDEEFWRKVVAINYEGCLRVTQALLGPMIERKDGRIVNIGSDAGRVGSAGEAVYAGAKGAVIAFTKTIAREAARSGVTANVVCPGPTETPLLDGMTAAAPDSARLVEALVRAVPMRRLAQPEEVAAAVAFLASERAAYITGQTLSVSGGLTMA
jgi:2-hydroxycyclohexanecarboxyl-CoA dehydrogenase